MNSTRISINAYLRLSFGSSCWKHVLGSGSKRLDAPFSAGTTQKWQVLRTPHAVWGKTRSAWWYRGEQLAQSVSAKLITRYRVSDWPEYQRFICWVIGACRLPRWPPIGQPQPGSGSLKLPSAALQHTAFLLRPHNSEALKNTFSILGRFEILLVVFGESKVTKVSVLKDVSSVLTHIFEDAIPKHTKRASKIPDLV